MRRLLYGAAAATFLVCGLVAGTSSAQTMAERMACKADFEKLCPGVEPGGGRILECLSKQKEKLSPDCAKVVAAHSK